MKRFFAVLLAITTLPALFGGCAVKIHDKNEYIKPPEENVTDEPQTPQPETPPEEPQTLQPEKPSEEPPEKPSDTDEISLVLRQMSLEEKVGQLFIVRPDALDFSQTPETVNDSSADGITELSETVKEALRNYPVGGVVMFGKNIYTPDRLSAFTDDLQNGSDIPLFIAVDEEGGSVARLANSPAFDLPKYESAAAIGESGDSENALNMGTIIGAYLRQYGFNLDFAPVADVNSNPDNTVIGKRAFSSDAETVRIMSHAMADGLAKQGVIPTFKHFPGHGDTAEDSHDGIAVCYKTKEEMQNCEWIPYKELTATKCVMVGHIALPDIIGDMTPSSLSYEAVSGILKGELNFDGVVITDSLSMGAVTNTYTPGDAAIKAVEAGCDILLCPYDLREAFDALVNAVENGTVSEERIDESVRRILNLKKAFGITE